MKIHRGSGAKWGILLALGALVVQTAPAAQLVAQDRSEDRECHCTDRDGNPIENCRCLRTPSFSWAPLYNFRGARLGISLDANQSDRDDARGARVQDVLDDGPADEAGLREDDIITAIDGRSLFDALDEDIEDRFDLDESIPVQRLMAISRELDAGETVDIEYLRDGDTHTTTLETRALNEWGRARVLSWDADRLADEMRALGNQYRQRGLSFYQPDGHRFDTETDVEPHVLLESRPNVRGLAIQDGQVRFLSNWNCPSSEDDEGRHLFVGLTGNCIGGVELMEMKPGLADYFGTSSGVLVTDVDEESTLGLEPGDVILAVDGREVSSPSHLRRILGSYEVDESIRLRIVRQKSEMSVQGTLR